MLFCQTLWLFVVDAVASRFSTQALIGTKACLTTIDTDLKDCLSECNTYAGQASAAISVQQCGKKINADIEACTTAFAESSPTSDTAAYTVNYLNGPLLANFKAYYQCLSSKKPGTSNVGKHQRQSLCSLFMDLTKFSISHVTSDTKSAAQAVQAKYEDSCSNENTKLSTPTFKMKPSQVIVARGDKSPIGPSQPSGPLQQLVADCNTYTSKIKAWDGSTSGAVAIQQAGKKFNDDIDSAATDFSNGAASTSAESQELINDINNYVVPCVKNQVDALIAQKSKFQANPSLYKIVKDRLASLKNSMARLVDALISKVSSDKKSAAQTAKSNLLAQIQRGVDAFP